MAGRSAEPVVPSEAGLANVRALQDPLFAPMLSDGVAWTFSSRALLSGLSAADAPREPAVASGPIPASLFHSSAMAGRFVKVKQVEKRHANA